MSKNSIDLELTNKLEIVYTNIKQTKTVAELVHLKIDGDQEDLEFSKYSDSDVQLGNMIPEKSIISKAQAEFEIPLSKTLDARREDENVPSQNKVLEKKVSFCENASTRKPTPLLKMYYVRASNSLDEIEFKLGVFVEFLLYHIAFFFLLGPIAPLLLRPFVGKTVLQNQFFWGRKSLWQCILWLLIVSSISLYVWDVRSNPVHIIFPIEIISLIIITFIRMVFISCKYAYATPTFLAHFRSRELSKEELGNEMMTTQFLTQDVAFIHQQIQESIIRLGIDTASFYFTFLGHDPVKEVNPALIKRSSLENAEGALNERKAPKKATKNSSKKSNLARIDSTNEQKAQNVSSLFIKKTVEITKVIEEEEEGPRNRFENHIAGDKKSRARKKNSRLSGKYSMATKARNAIPADIRDLSIAEGTFRTFQKLMLKEHELQKTMHSGYALAVELASRGVKSRVRGPFITTRLLSLFRAVLPLIVRSILRKPVIGRTPLEIYLNFSIMIITFLFFRVNLTIVSMCVNNTKTKLHLLAELSNLLPSRITVGLKKTHPPLNIFNPVSLRAWQDFRWLLMDYGYKFELRLALDATVYLIVYLVQLLFIVLYLLNLIFFPIDWATIIIGSFEALLASLVFFNLLIRGAMINDYFTTHRNQLLNCRGIISDIKSLAPLYFGEKPLEPDHIIKQEGIKYLKEVYKDKKEAIVELCVLHLEQLENIIDRMIFQLDNYEFNNCFEVLGFKITFQVVKGVVVGIISVVVAIINIQIKTNMKL